MGNLKKVRPEYDMRVIGRNLRRFREKMNLSVEEIRQYLCLGTVQAVYKYEEGRSFPRADTMFALMELYGVGIDEIVQEYDEKMPGAEGVVSKEEISGSEVAVSGKKISATEVAVSRKKIFSGTAESVRRSIERTEGLLDRLERYVCFQQRRAIAC